MVFGFETPVMIVKSNRYIIFLSLFHKILDFLEILIITCSTSDSERMVIMDRLDVEVQYRIAKWVFTNMMINGEITVEEYTEIHKKLIGKFDPPMKSVETPGFYLQEVMDDE